MCAGIGNEVRTVAFLIMTKLTIGFLRRGYSPTGGVEAYLKGLARGLLAEGHRPVLFGTDSWPVSEWPGGEILRCSGKSLSAYAGEVMCHKESSGIPFDLTLSVEKVPGCDIYRTDEGVHAAWLHARSPHISPWARFYQGISPKHREKLRLEREIFKSGSTRRVVSLSQGISRDITSYYGYPSGQITLIRNGVSGPGLVPLQRKEAARRELGISPGEKVMLFVGTGWERKGLRFAIRATELLGDSKVKLLVAGKGPEWKYDSPVVRFLGPVKEMESVYAAAELLLFPTIYDPFPLSAMEALAAGVPVITTAANGVSEIMTAGFHGEIVQNPSDVTALSKALGKWIALLEDPEQSLLTRESCVALASQYTLECNLRETLAVIRELMEEKSGHR
jgi:UDP-glucose:(heptosyl)LPS alpha-1,3-glucosyltransferase